MSEMRKRLARALCSAAGREFDYLPDRSVSGELDQDDYERLAAAGLEAMREPTEEMLAAELYPGEPVGKSFLDDYSAKRVWQLMIDGALGKGLLKD